MQRLVLQGLLACERAAPDEIEPWHEVHAVWTHVDALYLEPRRKERWRRERIEVSERLADLRAAKSAGSNSAAAELDELEQYERLLLLGLAIGAASARDDGDPRARRGRHGSDEGNISRAIASLARRGLVGRLQKRRTGYGALIALTAAGRTLAQRAACASPPAAARSGDAT